MARTSKSSIPLKRDAFMRAWRQFAAEESFAGMTLEEFKQETEDVVTVREEIETVRTHFAGLMRQRGIADGEMRRKLILVINAVRGEPAHGEDSPLYRALGYVPRSERSSGLSRRAPVTADDPQTPADANAA